MIGVKAARVAVGIALFVSGCHAGDTTAPRELSVIAVGSATDGSGQRVNGADVALQVLWPARTGTRLGCTGEYLIGAWNIRTAPDGEFGLDLRLTPPTTQVCLIAYGRLPGDSVWRDTAAVFSNLRVVEAGIVPDTARFDLTFAK